MYRKKCFKNTEIPKPLPVNMITGASRFLMQL